jgi:hypothetical protein
MPRTLLRRLLPWAALAAVPVALSAEMPQTATPPPAAPHGPVLTRLGVDRWHAAGHRGRGVTVAVLDSGFRGYRDHLGTVLPRELLTRSFRDDGQLDARDSQHGILCGEVIHALAPDARLAAANWEPERPEAFLAAVRWARQQGARVLSCSVIMPGWSDGEGGGPVHAELTRLLAADGGALLFACAGNTAQRHWAGPFTPDAAGWHQWEAGAAVNRLTPHAFGPDESVTVEVYWPAAADVAYEPVVFDTLTDRSVGKPRPPREGQETSWSVKLTPEAGRTYTLRLRQVKGKPGPFHLVAQGAGLGTSTAKGSIPFPGDGPSVVAVGAVDDAGRRLRYSSCGPNSTCPKPDLTAPVPFPSGWRMKSFAGTSAAAPQAAALAALLWARHPEWDAARVRRELARAARDVGPAGHDAETGHGVVRLPGLAPAPRAAVKMMGP